MTARRSVEWFGVDRAVAMTLVGRGWLIVASPLTMFFIARSLTPVEQGFYYTFSSLLALQAFFELGLSYVLTQYVSHQRAELRATPATSLDTALPALARISSALSQSMKWYAVIAALIIVALIPAGFFFFGKTAGHANATWRWPWVLLVIFAAANLVTVPYAAVLQGLGYVAEVAQVRLFQSIGQNAALWAGLLAGAALFTPGFASAASAILALSMAFGLMGRQLRLIARAARPDVHISWKHEIWPFQWRIAVSHVCGYFTIQAFNPIIFASRGAVEAGQLGMSLAIATGIATVAMAWISTKAPEFGELVALREWRTLDKRFMHTVQPMLFVCTAGLLAFLGGIELLRVYHFRFAERVLDPISLLLLSGATLCNVVSFAESVYVRAFRRDPFMSLIIVNAVALAVPTLMLAPRFGARGIMVVYLSTSFLIGLGGGTYIFFKKRREYQETADARAWMRMPIQDRVAPLEP